MPDDAITVVAPEDWVELDLDPVTRNASIAAMIEARLGTNPEVGDLRVMLEAHLRAALARAHDLGAVMAMAYAATDDEPPYVLSAWLLVTVHPTQSILDLDQTGHEFTQLGARVSALELPAGPALRAVRVTREPVIGRDDELDFVTARYVIPVPDRQGVAMLSFGTPNLTLQDEFVDLFDAIAESIEFDGTS